MLVFWMTFQVSVKNLLVHKLRSVLTMLGVILGVASVVVMLAVGEGSKHQALEQIRQLGANNIIIRSVNPQQREGSQSAASGGQGQMNLVQEYGLKYKDLDILLGALTTVRSGVPVILVRDLAEFGQQQLTNCSVLGTTADYFSIKHQRLLRGRFLTSTDVHHNLNVAVLSSSTAQQLFGFEDPIGKPLLLGRSAYEVVGVLAPTSGGASLPSSPQWGEATILIPLSTARRRYGELKSIQQGSIVVLERTELSEITLQVKDADLVKQTASMARQLLQFNHPTQQDFEVQVPLELLLQAEREKRIWNLVLGSIASVALVVGGIGIMNIMLASITERTREIGVRRALGATRRHITLQFLVESVVLSAGGGMLGVLLGVSIPVLITRWTEIETILLWRFVLLAFAISVSVGVVFGIYPARRAAWMQPIEALRHE